MCMPRQARAALEADFDERERRVRDKDRRDRVSLFPALTAPPPLRWGRAVYVGWVHKPLRWGPAGAVDGMPFTRGPVAVGHVAPRADSARCRV